MIAIGFLAITLLSGCLFPDDYDIKVVLAADGSYSYKFSGSAHAFEFLATPKEKIDKGSLQMLQSFMNKISAEGAADLTKRGYRNAKVEKVSDTELKGSGEKNGRLKAPGSIEKVPFAEFPIFVIQRQIVRETDVIILRNEKTDPQALRVANKANLAGKGRLTVEVADGEILDTNGKKAMFGKSLSWDVTLTKPEPIYIVVRAKAQP